MAPPAGSPAAACLLATSPVTSAPGGMGALVQASLWRNYGSCRTLAIKQGSAWPARARAVIFQRGTAASPELAAVARHPTAFATACHLTRAIQATSDTCTGCAVRRLDPAGETTFPANTNTYKAGQ